MMTSHPRTHRALAALVLIAATGCGAAPPSDPPRPSRPPPSRPAPLADPTPHILETTRGMIRAVAGAGPLVPATVTRVYLDQDGRLASAYVAYKHLALGLQQDPAARGAGGRMQALGASVAFCVWVTVYFGGPAYECLERAGDLPVPEELAGLVGDRGGGGEPPTVGESLEPVERWNDERVRAKLGELTAIDETLCRVDEVTSFFGPEDAASGIEAIFAISRTSSIWLEHVARFHLATVRCGSSVIELLLTEYDAGHRPSGEGGNSYGTSGHAPGSAAGNPADRLRVLTWQISSADDAALLRRRHQLVREHLGGSAR